NAPTYAGVSKNNEAVEYASKVINAGYSLGEDYQQMFAANNHLPQFSREFIMTVNYDGLQTKGFGGTHFLVHASLGGTMNKAFAGVEGPWAGLRATKNLPLLFPDTGNYGDNSVDRRSMFYNSGQSLEITNVSTFTDGYAVSKYRNIVLTDVGVPDSIGFTADSIAFRIPSHGLVKGNFIKVQFASPNQLNGNYTIGYVQKNNPSVFKVKSNKKLVLGSTTAFGKVQKINKGVNPDQTFVDIDYPLFRLAEMYLIYAEGTLRGGAGSLATATGYINNLRERAYSNSSANITEANLTLDFILDERARELYWEGHRRTDLIRYDRFVEGTYLWPFKGGVIFGAAISDFRKLFPIPVSDLTANPKLKQNPGY
ncbi:MAG TPA: RagB/SusD family nutrient uptake outer membrane protein, partial [Catalimonadaceae bacterium]|nr:RagB/SusD family nutrient uptake outer membrane protein [Catalimonadaceae bacterium]